MGWSGNVFTRVHNWVADAAASIDITASRFDAEDDNLASGIEACLRKSGENEPTADLPMATQKHLNVGNATARNHYGSAAQVQDGSFSYSADSGSADTYVMTLTPAITAYATGATYVFIAGNTNTGASTLNINGVGATAIRKNGTSVLEAGDIAAGESITCIYDGTFFQIKSLAVSVAANTSAISANSSAIAGKLTASNNLSDLGSASAARTNLGVDAAGTDNSTNVSLAGSPNYLTLAGQVITRALINLTSHVTGTLPAANGGTGATALNTIEISQFNVTVSTSDPSGTPVDGQLWIKREA